MTTTKSKDISAIYPLTDMQQALLYHHLISEDDEGSLVTECRLKGRISHQLFEKAWNIAAERHEALRNTVHWENLEKPFVVVKTELKVDFTFLDWQNHINVEMEKHLADIKNQIRFEPVNFQKNPLARVTLIRIGEEEYLMLWPTHHLLLDGWSGQVIITDVLKIYKFLDENSVPGLPPIPSYKSYLGWIQKQEKSEALLFWKEAFEHHQKSKLFSTADVKSTAITTGILRETLPAALTAALHKKASALRITMSTLIQGLWGIVLCSYFESDDIAFGTTVSGRSVDIKNIHLMAGMFMNMQPVSISLDTEANLIDWFSSLQNQRLRANQLDYQGLEEISSFIEWPVGRPLFDSLFIFENYPEVQTESGGIEVLDLKSGLTSTFPLTFTVVPGDRMELILASKLEDPDSAIGIGLLKAFIQLAEEITSRPIKLLKDLTVLTKQEYYVKRSSNDPLDNSNRDLSDYIPARNKVELEIVSILENVLGESPIGVRDNFFDLGVNSFSAVRFLNLINKKFRTKLLPTTILEYSTVEAISALISGGEGNKIGSWKNLVPISIKGDKNPLFCLHGGGGHVFYYNELGRNLAPERPVYALQPLGLFEEKAENRSVEEMADSYLKEIREVAPQGPYNLLAYCFSTALGVEMSLKLKQASEEVNLIILDSIVEQHSLKKGRFSMRFAGFAKRFLKNPYAAIKVYVINRFEMFVLPIWQIIAASPEKKQLARVRKQLIKAYKNYHWPSFDVPLKMLLTEKENELFNEELLNSWEAIYEGEMEIIDAEGEHRYLLEEPLVKITAEKINQACKG